MMMSKPLSGEVAYVGYLLLAAVVGRADFHLGILVQQQLTPYLGVHFGAPVVVAALRHAYAVGVFFLAPACRKQENGGENQYCGIDNVFHGSGL